MSDGFSIEIPLTAPIIVTIRELDDIYVKGENLVERLQKSFPELKIACADFETRENRPEFYKIKIECLPEEVIEIGKQIKAIVASFLKTI